MWFRGLKFDEVIVFELAHLVWTAMATIRAEARPETINRASEVQ